MRSKTLLIGGIGIVIGVLLSTAVVFAGNLNPGVGPAGAGSQMYTLQQIYDRLVSGAAGVKMTTFTEPTGAPGSTMRTLDEIMAAAPAQDNTNGATTAQVLTTKTFWGLRTDGTWGVQTGTMPIQTLSAANATVAAGYYAATTLSAVDSDLAAGNIKSGVDLFGVAGTLTAGGTYNASVPKTGAGAIAGYSLQAGEDGLVQKGVAWPNPRFITGTTGVVTDTLTGLIWLQNAYCPNIFTGVDWSTALSYVATLNSAGTMNGDNCGDTSNSGNHQTDWRLPNVREMYSLVHYGFVNPAVPDTAGTGKWTTGNPFTDVQASWYWTSTTLADVSIGAWAVGLDNGEVNFYNKAVTHFVWPVRGGQ